MPKRGRRIALALSIVFGTFAAAPMSSSQAQPRIGNATSISNRVEGIVGSQTRPLASGSDVFSNELVRTGDASVAQLVFLDSTNLSVGPKSQVRLDRFVYDPDRNTGTVAIQATRGVFRFVTGSQPSQNYTIQTPIATIGVRGTVFDLLVRRDRIVVLLVSGSLRVTTRAGRVVSVTQPNTAVTVYANGRIVGPVEWTGPIFDVASNAQFPYFGTLQTAGLPFIPFGITSAGYGWTGCYVGGNVGNGRAARNYSDTATGTDYSGHNASNVAGGAQAGCDYQLGSIVVGMRGVYDWASIAGDNALTQTTLHTYGEHRWLATLVGRAGVLVQPQMLLYAKGGAAWIRDDLTNTLQFNGAEFNSATVTRTGFDVGGGIEYMLLPNLSIFAEYDYLGFGTKSVDYTTTQFRGTNQTINVKQNVQMAVVGFNWRFNWNALSAGR